MAVKTFETRKQARDHKNKLESQGKFNIQIHKFAGKRRKKPFFVGTWWDWMAAIS